MQQTTLLLPTSVISTGATTGNSWSNTSAILLVNGQTADSNPSPGLSSDIIVGNFNFNIPVGASVDGIEFEVIGYRGPQTSPQIALTMYAVDDTSTVPQYYPYTAPFTGLTTASATYSFGTPTYLFATAWTVNQINNFKFQMVANGEVHIDAVLMKVYYTPSAGPTPPTPETGVCEEELQTQPFQLAIPLASTDTSMILTSFNYSDGSAIALADFGVAGTCEMVIDKGIPMYEENVRVTSITPLPNGNVQLGFTSVANRGLQFKTPYTTDVNLRKGHNTGAEVIISNNAPFYQRFLKKCQIDILVSAPISVLDEGIEITPHVHSMNFVGQGVFVQDAGSSGVNIVIPGSGGIMPPTVVGVGSGTSGNVQVTSLTYTVPFSGVNRGAIIEISMEEGETVTSVLVGGVPATQEAVSTDAPNNLRSEMWVCVSPPVGVQNVVITLSGLSYISSGCEAIVSMNQGTPVGDADSSAGSSLNPSATINTTADNSLVFDSLCTGITPIAYAVGVGQVLEWSHTANTDTRQGASSLQPAGTSPEAVVMDYTITQNTDWVMTALEILGIQTSADQYVRVDASDTTSGYLDEKIELIAGANVTINKTIQNIGGNEKISYEIISTGGSGGSGGGYRVDQTPDNGTYGLLAGAVNGINDTYSVSAGVYVSGKLVVTLNGLVQMQGASDDFIELVPGSGTFQFNTPPATGDIITAIYADSSVLPSNLEVEEDGVTIETAVTKINFKNGPAVTNPAPGEVDVDFAGLLGGGGSGTKLIWDPTVHNISDTGAYQTLYTAVIPGGTLGTSDVIRFTMLGNTSGLNGGTKTFRVKYGGAVFALVVNGAGTASFSNRQFTVSGVIGADGTTGSQKGLISSQVNYFNLSAAENQFVAQAGSCAVDSTVNQNLVIEVLGGSGSVGTDAFLVEKISSPGSTGPVNPAIQSFLFDDFIGGGQGTYTGVGTINWSTWGELGWFSNTFGAVAQSGGSSTSPGVLSITSNNSAPVLLTLAGGLGVLETASSTYEFRVKLGVATDDFFAGIQGAGNKYLFIRKSGANWTGVFNNGGGETIVGSIAATTNFVKLKIVVNGAGTTAEYFVDGVSLGTQVVTGAGGDMQVTIGNNTSVPFHTQYIDYFYFNRTLNR